VLLVSAGLSFGGVMPEPSLTVGLVPRTATRLVATHNYPTGRCVPPP
jgi:hypothetical protein